MLTIPVMVILGALVVMFVIKDNMNKFQLIVTLLFGIYLGDTAFGGNLQQWTDSFAQMIAQIKF